MGTMGRNSRNHPMFGGSLVWLQRCLAGVRIDPSSAAYSKIIVKPIIPKGLNQASYQIETVKGQVGNRWERNENEFQMTTTIPANSKAIVYLPVAEGNQWTENGNPLTDTEYLKVISTTEDSICVELTSGIYHFVGSK